MTRLVNRGTQKTALAIGDGANDFGIIQKVCTGVGISEIEGMHVNMKHFKHNYEKHMHLVCEKTFVCCNRRVNTELISVYF